jgi:hypothetical protein
MDRDNIVGFAYLNADAGAGVPVHAWTFEGVNAARMALEELACYDLEFHDIRWFRCSEREAPVPVLMEQVEHDADCWDTEDEAETDRQDAKIDIEDALFGVSCGAATVEETMEELKSIAKTYFDVEVNSIQFEELEELVTDLHGADVPDEEIFEAADKIMKIMRPDPWPFPKG